MENLYSLPPLPLSEELVSILTESPHLRVERIVSTGQVSDWYDQEEWEFVALLAGEAVLTFVDNTVLLRPGDTLTIPPHQRHRVSETSENPPCIWLCVFWADTPNI